MTHKQLVKRHRREHIRTALAIQHNWIQETLHVEPKNRKHKDQLFTKSQMLIQATNLLFARKSNEQA